jgi:hypothetical protein
MARTIAFPLRIESTGCFEYHPPSCGGRQIAKHFIRHLPHGAAAGSTLSARPLPEARMLDFEVHRCTRKCCETEAILQPGDAFYSALVAQGSHVIRKDYCAAAWTGPPAGSLGWWKSHVPDIHSHRMHWAPNDVILHYFEQLDEVESQADMRYVLALLMIRRRIVRLEDTQCDQSHGEVFVLYCPRNEREYRVVVASLTPRRVEEIQNQLAELLFAGKT